MSESQRQQPHHHQQTPTDTTIKTQSELFSTLQASLSTKTYRNSVHFEDENCSNTPVKTSTTTPGNDSQTSAAPGLMESIMTDGSSSMQSSSDMQNKPTGNGCSLFRSSQQPLHNMSSTYLMSSLQTVHSNAGIPSNLLSPSQLLQHSTHPSQHLTSPTTFNPKHSTTRTPPAPGLMHQSDTEDASAASVGFSQLLRAADDTHPPLGLSTECMAVVPEAEEMENATSPTETDTASELGALIVEPQSPIGSKGGGWRLPRLPSWGVTPQSHGLQAPLLATRAAAETPVTYLLSSPSNRQHGNTPLDRARETVEAVIEDDQSFEVSMTLKQNCTVEGVMRILGNPELLRLWCDPIETLIVTSSSTEGTVECSNNDEAAPRRNADESNRNSGRPREYEGEWIEATTTALGSPPSSVGFFYSTGQFIMETLGFASYGRITMFVERRRGHVGLTVGPFHGGISASHSISVSCDSNNGGRVKIVDRVRLVRDEEDVSIASFFMCSAFDSCLSRCVLPSVVGYLNQVTTSMARLRLLVENSDISSGNVSFMVVNAPRWT
jgi:hypothetical protein